jgi:hypothetical protein
VAPRPAGLPPLGQRGALLARAGLRETAIASAVRAARGAIAPARGDLVERGREECGELGVGPAGERSTPRRPVETGGLTAACPRRGCRGTARRRSAARGGRARAPRCAGRQGAMSVRPRRSRGGPCESSACAGERCNGRGAAARSRLLRDQFNGLRRPFPAGRLVGSLCRTESVSFSWTTCLDIAAGRCASAWLPNARSRAPGVVTRGAAISARPSCRAPPRRCLGSFARRARC